MIDWLKDFEEKYNQDTEVNNLKERRFFGKIQINFYDGQVVDLSKHQTRKPIKK